MGHKFADPALLDRALTHASTRRGPRPGFDNETLEFLGDRVLGLICAEALVTAHPELSEGELSQLQAALVSGRACAEAAGRLGLGPALRVARAAHGQDARANTRILGDAMEALMAAAYLDGGLDAGRAVFRCAWQDALATVNEASRKDPKSALQEWAMARALPLPLYEVKERVGPPHAPRFVVEVGIQGCLPERGEGTSRRNAEMAAARVLLARLSESA